MTRNSMQIKLDWGDTKDLMKGLWPDLDKLTDQQASLFESCLSPLNPEWVREACEVVAAQYATDPPRLPWIIKAFHQVRETHAARTSRVAPTKRQFPVDEMDRVEQEEWEMREDVERVRSEAPVVFRMALRLTMPRWMIVAQTRVRKTRPVGITTPFCLHQGDIEQNVKDLPDSLTDWPPDLVGMVWAALRKANHGADGPGLPGPVHRAIGDEDRGMRQGALSDD
jgi:hypothetical protein